MKKNEEIMGRDYEDSASYDTDLYYCTKNLCTVQQKLNDHPDSYLDSEKEFLNAKTAELWSIHKQIIEEFKGQIDFY